MADDADKAAIVEANHLQIAILNARNHSAPAANGACFNCSEPLSEGKKFCDPDCQHDYERLRLNRKVS